MKFILTLSACSLFLTAQAQSKRITFEAPQVYPEGIAFDNKKDVAYVSSVRTGTIGSVDGTGKYSEILADKGLKSTYGMKVDEKRNRLWVCSSDAKYSKYKDSTTFRKMARIIAIDLSTKQKVADIDIAPLFAGKHFLNDLTLDNKGNVYVTDSFSPVIYKIDAKGTPSVFSTHDLFKSKSIGLNGIVFHPDGFLLAAHNTNGVILKIDLKDPKKVEPVTVNQMFPGADGLWLDENKNLVLIQNKGVNKAFRLASTDAWKTANVSSATSSTELYQYPTTCGMRDGELYLLNAKLNELSDSSQRPSDKFSFQQIVFK